ncbi:hypothetical protein CRG98_031933 [Punica granatum]|nr:hypothetical protein CRG98_031933 [Punica granatum]
MRQKELQDEEERMQKREDLSSSSRSMTLGDIECSSAGAPSRRSHVEADEIVSEASCAASVSRQTPLPRSNRDDEFDLDLEEIMVMEAIWRSIQERGKQRIPCYGSESDLPEQYMSSEDQYVSHATAASSSSPSGGLACAIAALAERQQMSGESSSSSRAVNANENLPTYSNLNMLPSCSGYYPPGGPAVEISQTDGEWNVERGSELAEAGTSYRSSSSTEQGSGITDMPQQGEEVEDEGFQSLPAPIVPESFEEQMMLAMAVSLAEARVVTSGPGVTWH